MANYVKYSTNAQTRALKMGNFWLGPVNDGKGPTSSTGYYTSLNPPSGGFTIYANKASDGPAIFQASNESQLVSITNQLGGTSFTTSGQCLTWYVTQTDKFCVNRDYEGIVTNGLVLNLDAGFTPSYPTSGTSWYDLGPSGNTGTLTNGPTFNSSNGGSIVFDGVDDYAPIGSTGFSFGANPGTLSCWAKTNSIVGGYRWVLSYGTAGSGQSRFLGMNGDTLTGTPTFVFGGYGGNDIYYSPVPLNTWFNLVGIYDGTNASIYLNGVLVSGPTVKTWNTIANNTQLGRQTNGGEYWNGAIGSAQIYNRALTSVEVLQNYNAMKGRFGL